MKLKNWNWNHFIWRFWQRPVKELKRRRQNSLDFQEELQTIVTDFILNKIEKKLFPGAQVLIAHKGKIVLDLSHGSMLKGSSHPADKVHESTLFNIESITKVMVTLPLVFKNGDGGPIQMKFDISI